MALKCMAKLKWRLLLEMRSKKGAAGVGTFFVNIFAIIVIFVILTLFIFFNSFIKNFTDQKVGKVIYKEDSLGIDGGVGYMNNYFKLVNLKGDVFYGYGLDKAISEVGYAKS